MCKIKYIASNQAKEINLRIAHLSLIITLCGVAIHTHIHTCTYVYVCYVYVECENVTSRASVIPVYAVITRNFTLLFHFFSYLICRFFANLFCN